MDLSKINHWIPTILVVTLGVSLWSQDDDQPKSVSPSPSPYLEQSRKFEQPQKQTLDPHPVSTSGTAKPSSAPIILKPLPTGLAKVFITGSKFSQTTIFQVDGRKAVKRLIIPPAEEREVHFPPGQYFALSAEGRIPIPTIVNDSTSVVSNNKKLLKITFPNRWPHQYKDWCWIPPGPTTIGDRTGTGTSDEKPIRVMNIKGFYLSKTEVTNRQYAKFLNASKYFDSKWIDLESRKCGIKKEADGSFKATLPDHPIVMVSRFGADAYCRFLTRKTKVTHRLPTEWEWEKAAKGPENYVYGYGNSYQWQAANQESGELRKVGCFQPNGFGLMDITGNAFEWTCSRYNTELNTDEFNQSLRGGSFVLDGTYLRNSFRMKQSPEVMTDDFGFRVARMPKEKDFSKTGGK